MKYLNQKVAIKDIAVYTGLSLLTKGLSVSPLKLQKMLYYEQAWFMVFFGRENTLFAEKPQAWVNGPVYPDIYVAYKDKVSGMCDHLSPADFCEGDMNDALKTIIAKLSLDKEQLGCLESIITLYGSKTQNQLIFYTHSEKPWAEMREGMMPYERSNKELSLDTMFSYYVERHNRRKEGE